jgi:hypothetical protein
VELSNNLKIDPTDAFMKGQNYHLKTVEGTVMKKFPNNFWEYRVKLTTDVWEQTIFNKFIEETIFSRKEVLTKLSNTCYIEFYVQIKYSGDSNPSFHFDKNTIRQFADIGMEFDMELSFIK